MRPKAAWEREDRRTVADARTERRPRNIRGGAECEEDGAASRRDVRDPVDRIRGVGTVPDAADLDACPVE